MIAVDSDGMDSSTPDLPATIDEQTKLLNVDDVRIDMKQLNSIEPYPLSSNNFFHFFYQHK